jgi:hypothetical protein
MAATKLTLVRAPRECGSWTWWPDERAAGPVEQAATAARLAAITAERGLLEPGRVACRWEVEGRIVPGAWTAVDIAGAIEPEDLVARLTAARPQEVPEGARIGELVITGTGVWFDENGESHSEPGLLQLTVETALDDPSVGVEVYHDVWMSHDFRGAPHPEVYARNAPRLAEALAEIGDVLGTEAEPGEPTYFGHAVDLGVENAADDDDVPLDVTDLIDGEPA